MNSRSENESRPRWIGGWISEPTFENVDNLYLARGTISITTQREALYNAASIALTEGSGAGQLAEPQQCNCCAEATFLATEPVSVVFDGPPSGQWVFSCSECAERYSYQVDLHEFLSEFSALTETLHLCGKTWFEGSIDSYYRALLQLFPASAAVTALKPKREERSAKNAPLERQC